MTPKKLESLHRLAADERTPEEEARTAAQSPPLGSSES